MGFRYAIISGFLGQLKDRFKFYQDTRDQEEKFSLASHIEGAAGLELVYPYDFADLSRTKELLEKYGLKTAAVNVDIKGEAHWNKRALSAEGGVHISRSGTFPGTGSQPGDGMSPAGRL